MILFEWVAGRERAEDGALTAFRAELTIAQQAQLDSATMRLEGVDNADMVPKLIAGVKGYRHIYKLQIGGKVRLRPLLCRGPMPTDDKNQVLTFLIGARERDMKFVPRDAPKKAKQRREDLITGNAIRRPYETPTEGSIA